MKLKKIIAAVAAAAVSVSAMAVNVFADDEYSAVLGFADTTWTYQDWETSTTVTGDGQYTIESTLMAGAQDFGVFVIDITGMYSGNPDATAVLDKIEIDGSELSFDASKIIYGDIENKGNYRIEIYNTYGDTKNDPPVAQATPTNSSLKLTFTVSGLGGAAPAEDAAEEDTGAEEDAAPAETEAAAETPAADATTQSAGTGNVPAMAMVAVIVAAGTAAVLTRKRK